MTAPTNRELAVLAATLSTGRNKTGAELLGISEQTVKNHLTSLYEKLGAQSAAEAAFQLGWMKIPADLKIVHSPPYCGWVGSCHRWMGHTGQHGGFRAV